MQSSPHSACLADSRTNQNEACQLQQDNEGFSSDANGKYKLVFACDHSVAGKSLLDSLKDALKAYQVTVLQRCSLMQKPLWRPTRQITSARRPLGCERREKSRPVIAGLLLFGLEHQEGSMCEALHTARDIDAYFRCTGAGQVLSRGRIHQLVAATQQVKGDPDSEVDRDPKG